MPEDQTLEIDRLYRDWERRILWKANNLEDKRHESICGGNRDKNWCKCRKHQDEVAEWEDWFLENYDKAPDERDWRIPVSVLQKVSVNEPTDSRQHSERAGT